MGLRKRKKVCTQKRMSRTAVERLAAQLDAVVNFNDTANQWYISRRVGGHTHTALEMARIIGLSQRMSSPDVVYRLQRAVAAAGHSRPRKMPLNYPKLLRSMHAAEQLLDSSWWRTTLRPDYGPAVHQAVNRLAQLLRRMRDAQWQRTRVLLLGNMDEDSQLNALPMDVLKLILGHYECVGNGSAVPPT